MRLDSFGNNDYAMSAKTQKDDSALYVSMPAAIRKR